MTSSKNTIYNIVTAFIQVFRKRFSLLVSIAISIFCFYYLGLNLIVLRNVNLLNSLLSKWFFITILLVVFANLVRAFRWSLILKYQSINVSFYSTVIATFIGMWLSIVSTTVANDFAKPYYISKTNQVPFWSVMGTCFIERFFDGFYTAFVIAISWCFLHEHAGLYLSTIVFFFIIVMLITCTIVFFPYINYKYNILTLWREFAPKTDKLVSVFEKILSSSNIFLYKPHKLVIIFLTTSLHWLLLSLSIYIVITNCELPKKLSNMSASLSLTSFYGVSTAVPSVAVGAGVVNLTVNEFLMSFSKLNQISINDKLLQNITNSGLLIYFSGLLADVLAGFYFYALYGKILFKLDKKELLNEI